MSVGSAICDQPKRLSGVFSTGFALFSMFFGAGNLIFPLLIGKAAGAQTPVAIWGLLISAVAFPLMGLLAMMLYQGNLYRFLERLGKIPAALLLFVLMITQGPLCISRLFTLMHASIKSYLPISLFVFNILCGALVFFLTYRPQKVIGILGKILTPFLVISLVVLVVAGMIHPPAPMDVFGSSGVYFLQGLKGGYMTMDLISALLFATMILPHLAKGMESLPQEVADKLIRHRMIGASLVAAALLMLSYFGLCLLSSHYTPLLDAGAAPEDLLRLIAVRVLGSWGGAIAAVAVFFACLTTAIALCVVFSDYLRLDLFKKKLGSSASLALTLVATAAIATLGFSGIARVLGPILESLYPALIVLCLCNIAHALYQAKPLKGPVGLALGIAALSMYLG